MQEQYFTTLFRSPPLGAQSRPSAREKLHPTRKKLQKSTREKNGKYIKTRRRQKKMGVRKLKKVEESWRVAKILLMVKLEKGTKKASTNIFEINAQRNIARVITLIRCYVFSIMHSSF